MDTSNDGYLFQFRGVGKSYGSQTIFKNLNLDIDAGSSMVLSGASGSGKTTFIRLLLGFDQPDRGQIYYRDRTLSPGIIGDLRSRMAWVPQEAHNERGAVRDVALHPFTFGVNRELKPTDDKLKSTLQELHLNIPLDRRYNQLSGGEKKRLRLAIALLLERPVLLLDEPTASLDDNARKAVMNTLFNLPGKTIISTSHDHEWIEKCDTVREVGS